MVPVDPISIYAFASAGEQLGKIYHEAGKSTIPRKNDRPLPVFKPGDVRRVGSALKMGWRFCHVPPRALRSDVSPLKSPPARAALASCPKRSTLAPEHLFLASNACLLRLHW
jgi:hypothetical protein